MEIGVKMEITRSVELGITLFGATTLFMLISQISPFTEWNIWLKSLTPGMAFSALYIFITRFRDKTYENKKVGE